MIITPKNNNASVAIPAYQSQALNGGQPQQQQQQIQHNPAQFVGLLLQPQQGRSNGMIGWGDGMKEGYQDPYLATLAEQAKLEGPNSVQVVRHKVSQAIEFYFKTIVNQSGFCFNVYKSTIENFKMDKFTRRQCPIHTKFVESLHRNPQYLQTIIRNSAIFFGYGLIPVVQNHMALDPESSPFNQSVLSHATEQAVRNVLFLEMINWLDKSKVGKELSFNLPASITAGLVDLEKVREFTIKVFSFFDAPSPYIDLQLNKENPEAYQIINPALTDTSWAEEIVQYQVPEQGLNRWLLDEANRYANEAPQPKAPVQEQDYNEMSWGRKTTETNLKNLTRKNIRRYDFRDYLKPVPTLENTYIADPAKWVYIERLFTDAPIGVWDGTFVVIEADVDELNQGGMVEYQTELFKLPGRLTMEQVLTDPSTILPVLKEDPEGSVVVVDVQENTVLNKDEVKPEDAILPDVAETVPENALAVVNTKDKMHEINVETIVEQSTLISKTLTNGKKNMCALVLIEGKTNFLMENPEETKYIKDAYSNLFRARKKEPNFSWIKMISLLKALRNDKILGDGVAEFVIACTTQQINSVLSGHYGYDLNKDGDNYLKLDDVVADFDELVEFARENNTQLFEDMHCIEQNTLLNGSYVLVEDTSVNVASMPDSGILRDCSIYVGREFIMYNVNSETSPVFVSGEKTNVSRSFFPALFSLIDKVTNPNKGILIRFNEDDKLWLAQSSALTEDFLTLRVLKNDSVLPWVEFA